MAKGSATAQLLGNLGSNPETRYTPNGTMVCNFSLAVNSRRKSPDSHEDPPPDWYRVICFGKLAEIADQYLAKGNKAYVTGRLQIDRWESNDGRQGTTVELIANELTLLTPRDEQASPSRQTAPSYEDPDDLPF